MTNVFRTIYSFLHVRTNEVFIFFLHVFLQEVWTLCRILKRNASCKKYNIPDWRELVSSKTNPVVDDESCKTCGSTVEMMNGSTHENYVSSEAPSSTTNQQNEKKQFVNHVAGETNQLLISTSTVGQLSSIIVSQTPSSSSSPFGPRPVKEFTTYGDWDELTPVVEFAFNPFLQ